MNIAEESGFTEKTLFRKFKTKENLFNTTIQKKGMEMGMFFQEFVLIEKENTGINSYLFIFFHVLFSLFNFIFCFSIYFIIFFFIELNPLNIQMQIETQTRARFLI